ncbi:hypothetical protein chiPu_0029969 [Chiloscyllium punctatum]|uniref:Uncharacterized protein n=1 Tax=Chiloscyllium punctatum TaxID=137246 RepID=A0A401TU73_CHIPU|nr:hypothetical protein [Chiloscyllium punctatum]
MRWGAKVSVLSADNSLSHSPSGHHSKNATNRPGNGQGRAGEKEMRRKRERESGREMIRRGSEVAECVRLTIPRPIRCQDTAARMPETGGKMLKGGPAREKVAQEGRRTGGGARWFGGSRMGPADDSSPSGHRWQECHVRRRERTWLLRAAVGGWGWGRGEGTLEVWASI